MAILSLVTASTQIGKMFDTPTYMVTAQMMSLGAGTFTLFVYLLTILYSGIIINNERKLKIHQLIDTTPVSNAVLFGSKLVAIIKMQLLLLAIPILIGIIIQAVNGYYLFEINLYLKEIFGLQLIKFLLFAVLCLLIQVFVKNYFVGFFVLLAWLILQNFIGKLGIDQDIYKYNFGPGYSYSDMNGYGAHILPYYIYKIYWSALAVIFIVLSIVFWPRGSEFTLKRRWRLMKYRFNLTAISLGSVSLLLFVFLGGWIYYQTNIDHERKTPLEREKRAVAYEKKYRHYKNLPQPRITDVNVNVDIFPKERKLRVDGIYKLLNKTNMPIDTIFISYYSIALNKNFSFSKDCKLFSEDEKWGGTNIYVLNSSLNPGESMEFHFQVNYQPKNQLITSSPVIYNGTFFNNGHFPDIGYNDDVELSGKVARKKYGLPEKERMASINDSLAAKNTGISTSADWINFETTISTTEDQIAIAPGYLQKEWKENGRSYFHYKMDSKILNFYAFISAKYEIKKDKWISTEGKEVAIEIYYHKGHPYNVDKMIKGIKKALDYYSTNFSAYQHRQVRIIEFPRTGGSFAQSFPNTIPFSEGIGFIAKVDEKDDESIDYPFYVTAHEVAHQWWGHQVAGANVQGQTFITESMSQYGALMVMKKEYGKQQMTKFLKYEMDKYLRGRGNESKKELPIIRNEGQQYIHYHKGSILMYALQEYIGEDNLNSAIKKYIKAVAFQEPPYTNSLELLDYFKEATPDSLQYLLTDMFENITFYENEVVKSSSKKLKTNKYQVDITFKTVKGTVDSIGKAKELKTTDEDGNSFSVSIKGADLNTKLDTLQLSDWIEIGVFAKEEIDGKEKEKVLYLKKHKFTKSETTISVIVDEEPTEVGIDPYYLLIDRNGLNNRKKIGEDGEKKSSPTPQ